MSKQRKDLSKERQDDDHDDEREGDDRYKCECCSWWWLCPLYWIYQCLRICCCSNSRVHDSEKGCQSIPLEPKNDPSTNSNNGYKQEPVPQPSPQPSTQPSPQPSPQPSAQPSAQASPQASPQPSPQPSPPKSRTKQFHPVVGLQNLGNTCFFDAALQAINQTDQLHNLYVMMPYQKQPSIVSSWAYHDPKGNYRNLTAVPYTKEYPVPNKICEDTLNVKVTSMPGPLTSVLQKTLWMISNSNSYFAPRELLHALGKRDPRFARGTQEDSHEALRCLFDAIKTEELENVKEKVTNTFGPTKDGEDKLILKGYLRMVSKLPTAIGQVVEGAIISTTICHDCYEVIENLEPFFDISVPMPDDTLTEEKTSSLQWVGSTKPVHMFLSPDPGISETVVDKSKLPTKSNMSSNLPNLTSLNKNMPKSKKLSQTEGDGITNTGTAKVMNTANSSNQDTICEGKDDKFTNTRIVDASDCQQQQKDVIRSEEKEPESTAPTKVDDSNPKSGISSNPQGVEENKTASTDSKEKNPNAEMPTNCQSKETLSTDLDTIQVEQPTGIVNKVKDDPVSNLSVAKNDNNSPLEVTYNSQEDISSNSSGNADVKKLTGTTQQGYDNSGNTDDEEPPATDGDTTYVDMQGSTAGDEHLHHSDATTAALKTAENQHEELQKNECTHAGSKTRGGDAAGRHGDNHSGNEIVPVSTAQSEAKIHNQAALENTVKKLQDPFVPLAMRKTHNRYAFQQFLKDKGLHYQAAKTKMSPNKFSLQHCLAMHTNLDVLDENNKFICQNCTEEQQKNGSCSSDDVVLCQVSKQLTIHKLPPVLILHFKRFDLSGPTVTKDNQYISFPEVLDVAPYCTDKCIKKHGDKDKKILYGLYAVVVHQGRSIHSGHYIAYVKKQPIKHEASDDQHHGEDCNWREYKRKYGQDRKWYFTSDTYTKECEFEEVKKCEAYMLFYELLPLDYGTNI